MKKCNLCIDHAEVKECPFFNIPAGLLPKERTELKSKWSEYWKRKDNDTYTGKIEDICGRLEKNE